MSDDRQWQAPEGAQRPPASPNDSPALVAPPGVGRQQPGWTPPPKPGLIPLRPLDLGTILGASFSVLRRNPRPTFGVSLIVQGVVSVVAILVVGLVSFFALSRIDFSTEQDAATITAGTYGIIGLSAIVPLLLGLVASALLQGIVVLEVSRGTLGEKERLPGLWRRARGRIGALVGWTALVALAVVAVIAVVAGLVVLLVATLGLAGIVFGVLIGVFGGLGLLVVYFWLNTKLALVPSVLMLERLTLRQAVRRSWSLTTGYFWRILGIQLLVAVIVNVVSQVISAPLTFIGPLVVGLVDPNGQNGAIAGIVVIGIAVLAVVVSVVFAAITAVVQTATTALIYLDIRIRKEGLDLELARFIEARESGDSAVADPYLVTREA